MRLSLDICCLKRPLDDQAQLRIRLDPEAAELMSAGIRGFDALHVASAEAARADVFVTCDDRLLAITQRLAQNLLVRTAEPTIVVRGALA